MSSILLIYKSASHFGKFSINFPILTSKILFCYTIIMLPITIRKRTITFEDIEFIQALINDNWNKGRIQISKILCQKWNWVQPNGRLKDMACREVLLTLYRRGLIDYPPGLHDGNNKIRNKTIPFVETDQTPLKSRLSNLDPVKLKLVGNSKLELLYNSLVASR